MESSRFRTSVGIAGFLVAVLVALAGLARPAGASIVTVTSADFSLGYGRTAAGWGTTETAGSNTPTTDGSFSFTPTVTGIAWTSVGPKFLNRVLGDGENVGGQGGDYVGDSYDFLVSIAGSYDLALPPGATNPQLTLNITAISLWAIKSDYGVLSPEYNETTPSHTSTSSMGVTLNDPADFSIAANYKQLLWNPADFAVAGTSSTRTFTLGAWLSNENPIDGLDILGNVTLTYNNIPEPATMSLLALGGLAMIRRSRR